VHQSPSITKERQEKKRSLKIYKCVQVRSAGLPHATTYIRDGKLLSIAQAGNLLLALGDEVIVVDVV
jgi:hypothetical protein